MSSSLFQSGCSERTCEVSISRAARCMSEARLIRSSGVIFRMSSMTFGCISSMRVGSRSRLSARKSVVSHALVPEVAGHCSRQAPTVDDREFSSQFHVSLCEKAAPVSVCAHSCQDTILSGRQRADKRSHAAQVQGPGSGARQRSRDRLGRDEYRRRTSRRRAIPFQRSIRGDDGNAVKTRARIIKLARSGKLLYHRNSPVPHVRPPPKPHSSKVSPREILPAL